MFFRRRKPPVTPTPSWMRWLVLGFLVFIIASGLRKGTPEAPNHVQEAMNKAADQLSPQKIVNFTEYRNKLFPSYATSMRSKDVEPGQGAPAGCGQDAKITYKVYGVKGEEIENMDVPQTFRIGGGEVLPALEQAVVGMRRGGMRSVLAQPNMAYASPQAGKNELPQDTTLRFDIRLIEAQPELPNEDQGPFRIAIVQNGMGDQIACGMKVKTELTFWDVNGEKLYTTVGSAGGPISFTPGLRQMPVGIEQGALGMSQTESRRTLILPPAFQQVLGGEAPAKDFSLPENQTVLVDIESVP